MGIDVEGNQASDRLRAVLGVQIQPLVFERAQNASIIELENTTSRSATTRESHLASMEVIDVFIQILDASIGDQGRILCQAHRIPGSFLEEYDGVHRTHAGSVEPTGAFRPGRATATALACPMDGTRYPARERRVDRSGARSRMSTRRSETTMEKARYPSFRDLRPSSPASSNAKRANRARATKAEVCLQRALRKLGLRFSPNNKLVLGIPDVVLVDTRIAIFCDGDFWHGRRWPELCQALQQRANAVYWLAKIAANRRRDQTVTRSLRKAGWCVMRFWETDIYTDVTKIAAKIAARATQRLTEATDMADGRGDHWRQRRDVAGAVRSPRDATKSQLQ